VVDVRYELVLFSNQSRISFDSKAKLFPQWKQKLQAIAETVTLCLPWAKRLIIIA
jgi:hypothetical protein